MSNPNLEIKIPFHIHKINEHGFHIFVHININNKPAHFLIDTGASQTIMDLSQAKEFVGHEDFPLNEEISTGLGTNSMQSHWTIIKEFKIESLLLKKLKIMLVDMKHINESYQMIDLPVIDGVIGCDLLQKHKAIIDFNKKNIILKGE